MLDRILPQHYPEITTSYPEVTYKVNKCMKCATVVFVTGPLVHRAAFSVWCSGMETDPPENCHLNVKKLPQT